MTHFLGSTANQFVLHSWSLDGLLRWCRSKVSACQCRRCRRRRFDPWLGKIPEKRKRQPTPVFLSEESHEQRSPMGYSPSSYKESDMTEWLSTHACARTHTHTRIHRINTHGRGDQKVTKQKLYLWAPYSVPVLMAPPLHFHLSVHGLFDNSAAKSVALQCNSRYFKTQSWHVFEMNWKHLKISREEAKSNWSPNHLNRNWQTRSCQDQQGGEKDCNSEQELGGRDAGLGRGGLFLERCCLIQEGQTGLGSQPQAQLCPNPWQAQLGGGAQGSLRAARDELTRAIKDEVYCPWSDPSDEWLGRFILQLHPLEWMTQPQGHKSLGRMSRRHSWEAELNRSETKIFQGCPITERPQLASTEEPASSMRPVLFCDWWGNWAQGGEMTHPTP